MNARTDVDARLTRLLIDEAPPHAPERVVETARSRVAVTRQRRLIVGHPGRLPMSMVSPAAVLAAAFVVAITGAALFVASRNGPTVGTGPSAPPASVGPSASTSPLACPTGQGTCLGLLQPGTHRSSSFLPAVGYSVDAGWANTLDTRVQLDLTFTTGGQSTYPDGTTFRDGISVFRKPVAESTTSQARAPGVGETAGDLTHWLVAHPGLSASAPTPVSIGGANGYRLTLTVPAGTNATADHCAADHGDPRCVSLFISSDPTATFGFGLVGPEIADVFLLDTPSGDTVMVVIDDVDGIDQPNLETAAMPIVNSLSFSP